MYDLEIEKLATVEQPSPEIEDLVRNLVFLNTVSVRLDHLAADFPEEVHELYVRVEALGTRCLEGALAQR